MVTVSSATATVYIKLGYFFPIHMTFHLPTLHLVLLLHHSYSSLWGSSTALHFIIFDSRLCWPTMYLFFSDSLWTCWTARGQHSCLFLSGEDRLQSPALCLLSFNQLSMLMRAFPSFLATYCLVTWWLGHFGEGSCRMSFGNSNRLSLQCLLCSPVPWLFHELSHKFLRCDFSLQKLCYVSMKTLYHLHSCTTLFFIITEFLFFFFQLYIIMQISLMATELWRGCLFCDYRLFCMKT